MCGSDHLRFTQEAAYSIPCIALSSMIPFFFAFPILYSTFLYACAVMWPYYRYMQYLFYGGLGLGLYLSVGGTHFEGVPKLHDTHPFNS